MISHNHSSLILQSLVGSSQETAIWLMRQAGRYLPEYRSIRARAGSFLELCYSPDLAVEITLQPIRRFDFDAAILFSDILVVPDALGRKVEFTTGEGPRLDPIDAEAVREIGRIEVGSAIRRHLAPVFDATARVRRELGEQKALIGFCGAPWTVATYMIAGRGTPDQAPARLFAAEQPEVMNDLIHVLVDASIEYLVGQLEAGADLVQIFDSWAGVLGEREFERWCVDPTAAIVRGVRSRVPEARVIGFPRGAGLMLERYAKATNVDAVGLDWTVPLGFARDNLQSTVALQGNLDPMVLSAGGQALDDGVDEIMKHLSGGKFIFNLGHGIVPQTPIANVARLVDRVRGWKGEAA